MLMVQDKVSGARHDLTITPVRSGTLALGYYIATLLSTLLVYGGCPRLIRAAHLYGLRAYERC